eukprot:TRINITY_DN106719_c0_g1_i1.p2 TRINITY_DN106719_c0_g1~~TRINITY_DN106719_c0_g1_i1.p2  ORF type:complete len:327 (-),score=72.07 TRINITY_DN106719_c0_g1_i1:366-1298(-)
MSGPCGGFAGLPCPPHGQGGKRRQMTKGIRMGSYVLVKYAKQAKIGSNPEDEDIASYEGTLADRYKSSQDRESYVVLKDVLKQKQGKVIGYEQKKRLYEVYIEEATVDEKPEKSNKDRWHEMEMAIAEAAAGDMECTLSGMNPMNPMAMGAMANPMAAAGNMAPMMMAMGMAMMSNMMGNMCGGGMGCMGGGMGNMCGGMGNMGGNMGNMGGGMGNMGCGMGNMGGNMDDMGGRCMGGMGCMGGGMGNMGSGMGNRGCGMGCTGDGMSNMGCGMGCMGGGAGNRGGSGRKPIGFSRSRSRSPTNRKPRSS